MSKLRGLLAVLVAMAVFPLTASGQERGTITGQVIDGTTQQPLSGVQIFVVGSQRGTLTNQQGRFVIPNIPTGPQQVLASLIGYSQQTLAANVASGQSANLSFTLQPSAVELAGVIVTASGGQQRLREIGNAVTNIDIAEVNLAPITNVTQLIQGRAAGVSVLQSSGTTGTGARIRIRGSNSISLNNDPLLIIDGIRVDNASESSGLDLAGQNFSRLNDINPEEIESIEILKGPAASALYGTAAANGVIQITTKRGRAGETQWNVYSELGTIIENNDYPANYAQRGTLLTGTNAGAATANCNVTRQAAGTCVADGVLEAFNPLETNSPFRDGSIRTFGLNASGGSESTQFFFAGEMQDEDGIYEINYLDQVNLRANISSALRDNLDLSVQTGYVSSDARLPYNDNAVEGIVSSGLLGSPFADDPNGGYFAYPLERRFALDNSQEVERFIGSANTNWRPLNWLSVNGTFGMDILNRNDYQMVQPNIFLPTEVPDYAIGYRFALRGLVRNYTGNLSGTGNWEVSPNLLATTTVGGQYLRDVFQRVDAGGYSLLPGTGSLGGLSDRFEIDELNTEMITVGGYASQQFAWNDRVFVTGALRGDRNSSFGEDFDFIYYPSLSTSWVVAEEPWFPEVTALTTLRLRAAYGESGLSPADTAALAFFRPIIATVQDVAQPGVTIGGAGNVELKPERSREYEFGLDAGLLDERVGVELTYYNKKSTDAIVSRRLAPSLGSSRTQFVNLGSVSNRGWETLVRADLLRQQDFTWDATFTYSTNQNELEELGEGIDPIVFGIGGNSQRHAEGLPLGGYYGQRIVSFADANGDGVLGINEVEISDEPQYLGTPFPTREASFNTGLTLFNVARITTLIDYKGGHKLLNNTEEFRCSVFVQCRGIQDRSAPLEDQAAAIAAAKGAIGGFVEDADFIKLREVALTLTAPMDFSRRFGVDGVSLTLSGRNLGTWTDYKGLDPELNSGGQANFSAFDFLAQPPVRTYVARLDVRF